MPSSIPSSSHTGEMLIGKAVGEVSTVKSNVVSLKHGPLGSDVALFVTRIVIV